MIKYEASQNVNLARMFPDAGYGGGGNNNGFNKFIIIFLIILILFVIF